MRTWFASIIVAIVISYMFFGLYQDYNKAEAEQGISLDHVTKIITKTFTSAQSNYELLDDTALSSDQNYIIESFVFSTYAINQVYFNDSGVALDRGYGPWRAGSNDYVSERGMGLLLTTACGFYITTEAEASADITLEYYIR